MNYWYLICVAIGVALYPAVVYLVWPRLRRVLGHGIEQAGKDVEGTQK